MVCSLGDRLIVRAQIYIGRLWLSQETWQVCKLSPKTGAKAKVAKAKVVVVNNIRLYYSTLVQL